MGGPPLESGTTCYRFLAATCLNIARNKLPLVFKILSLQGGHISHSMPPQRSLGRRRGQKPT